MKLVTIFVLTALLMAFLCLNHCLRGKISAKARYLTGILLALAFLFPFRFPIFYLDIPRFMITHNELSQTESKMAEEKNTSDFSEEQQITTENIPTISGKAVLGILYFSGVIISLYLSLNRHMTLLKTVKRCGKEPNTEMLWQMNMLCGKLRFRRKPRLLVCHHEVAEHLGAPFTFGIFHHVILMPNITDADETEMLLEHELYHCKRYDTLLRLLFILLRAFYWWYVPIFLLVDALEMLCEEACDEHMMDGKNSAYRNQYGKLLVRSAAARATLFVSFGYAKKNLKYRIEGLFIQKTKNEGNALVLLMLYAIVFLFGISMEVPENLRLTYTAEAYRETASVSSELEAVMDALQGKNELNRLNICSYMTKESDFHYIEHLLFCYEGYPIAAVVAKQEDGAETVIYQQEIPERYIEMQVKLRLIYDGEDLLWIEICALNTDNAQEFGYCSTKIE